MENLNQKILKNTLFYKPNRLNATHFGIKNTLDYRSKNSKICSILYTHFKQKSDFTKCDTVWDKNHTCLLVKKVKTLLDNTSAI